MASHSPVDDSTFDGEGWKDIVELATRLEDEAASGVLVDGEQALDLARAILLLEGGQLSSCARLRTARVECPESEIPT